MQDLTHLFEVSAAFSDNSRQLNDYLRESVEINLESADFHYIGLYKPFSSVYIEMNELNVNLTSSLTLEYWNGTIWVALPNLKDDTINLQRSGFIEWEFNDRTSVTDTWIESAVDSTSKHWIRISVANGIHGSLVSNSETTNTTTVANISDANISLYSVGQSLYIEAEDSYHTIDAVDPSIGTANIIISPALALAIPDNEPLYSLASYSGVNVVYADDIDLKSENRAINDYLAEGDTSFIAYHVAARNEIVQTLRNGGNSKNSADTSLALQRLQMNKWDILDRGEIRQAAKYLCLSKIFFDSSDNIEDKSYERFKDYEGMYGASFKLFYMSLDLNDDGNTDVNENMELNGVTVSKV